MTCNNRYFYYYIQYESINIFSDIHNQTLCGYSHTSMMGAQQTVAVQRATFNDIISIGEQIKVDTTQCLEDRLADIAFGKRICQPLLYLYCAGYGDAGRYGGFFSLTLFAK